MSGKGGRLSLRNPYISKQATEGKMLGTYYGITRDTQDAQRRGRIAVFIPSFFDSSQPEDVAANWFNCEWSSPFWGQSYRGQSGSGEKNYTNSQSTYGMWMVPPDPGNFVLVCFADGKRKFAGDSEMKEELNEAYATVKTLKSELNEINLLNAKLLYTNKVFRNSNLSEQQKVKVLSAFDKAETVKETKLVFETINNSFKEKKKPISESYKGSASAATAPKTTKRHPIVESNEMVLRFKKLAGIV